MQSLPERGSISIIILLVLVFCHFQSVQAQPETSGFEILILPSEEFVTEDQSFRCLHVEGENGCSRVYLKIPENYEVGYSGSTQEEIQHSQESPLTVTRRNDYVAIAIPLNGAEIDIKEQSGNKVLQSHYFPPNQPGTTQYYRAEIRGRSGRTEPTSFIVDRRRSNNPPVQTESDEEDQPPLLVFPFIQTESSEPEENPEEESTEPEQDRQPDESQTVEPRSSDPAQISREDKSNFIYALDYSSTIYTSVTPGPLSTDLTNIGNGNFLMFSWFNLTGAGSTKAGISVLAYDQFFGNQKFTYTHGSFFISWAPTLSLVETKNSHTLLYLELGASINSIDYKSEEITIYKDKSLLGALGGLGFVFNYKSIGFHLGVHYESLMNAGKLGAFEKAYPMVGIIFR